MANGLIIGFSLLWFPVFTLIGHLAYRFAKTEAPGDMDRFLSVCDALSIVQVLAFMLWIYY